MVEFDSDAVLGRLRELAAHLNQVAVAVGVEPTEADRDVLVEFLDKARGLDVHLMGGGPLPASWSQRVASTDTAAPEVTEVSTGKTVVIVIS